MYVADAAGARAADAAAIAAGIPARALMQRAGAWADADIARLFSDERGHGILVATGAGTNGGYGGDVASA
ncbi:MAG: bifunctional ADP-dependent NAD(P)H-hydrate dehydratase/NAD(P)H-hydrate epimerase, partial [Gemmatimonadaceae bacterium]|nr:bifunctional ADP-dependent NAD(P)H-hydrate dehydratase/NAD(P)H-hydrate epimerase [Gemmatimonadaceae bacterium]